MHIQVSDILAQGEGYQTSFAIANEGAGLDDPPLAEKLNGELTVMRTEDGLAVNGEITTAVTLQCHRCLRDYAFPETLELRGEFVRQPSEDQWPIEKDQSIDLTPLIRQEVILGLPIKQLCGPDCPGLDPETGQLKPAHNEKEN